MAQPDRALIEAEQRLHRAAELMAERERHAVRDAGRDVALVRAETEGELAAAPIDETWIRRLMPAARAAAAMAAAPL